MGLLELIIIILVIMWILGMATSYTLGGLLHFLLLVALIVFIIRLLRGNTTI